MELPHVSEPILDTEKHHFIPHYFIFPVLYYIIGTCIFLINSSILFSFMVQRIRRPNLARLSPSGFLVLNLLTADALVGLNVIALTATETHAATMKWLCAVRPASAYLTLIGSHVALINIAIDRYIAILYTLHYRDWMTTKRSVAMIMLGWLVPIVGAASGVLMSNDWRPGLVACEQMDSFRLFVSYVLVPSHVFALLIVIVFHCCAYLQLRRYDRLSQTNRTVLKRYSKKSARVLFRVTSTFVLCWGPFDVALLIIIVWETQVIRIIFDTLFVVTAISFLVNPTIFSFKTQNIRKPVIALLADIKAALMCGETVTDTPKEGGGKAPTTIVTISSSGLPLTHSASLENV